MCDILPNDVVPVFNYDGVAETYVETATSYYLLVPENIRHHFENSGWGIFITKEDLGNRFGYNSSVRGITCYSLSQIWIEDRDSAMTSVVHEMGHYLDYQLGWVSISPEFVEIWQQESGNFYLVENTHRNNTSTAMEYFAESFKAFVLKPELLQVHCPRTYGYLLIMSGSL